MSKALRIPALLAIGLAVVLTPAASAQSATAADTRLYEQILSSAYVPDAPGAAALVARDDEIVYLDAIGMANLELGVSLAPDMVFEIGSITKQFTAAAIMMLAEEGRLSVSDPITKHLPDYPAYGDDITIEHLLTHTSGIVSYTGIPGYMVSKVQQDVTPAELIDVFKDLPVEFAPGERWAYNNSGYILLGAIIEAVSGMPYAEFVKRRIFEPLGMQGASYGSSSRIIPKRASGYDGGDDGVVNQRYLSFTQPYAAGSLMMTVEDWHRWSRALFGGGVVSEESLKSMTTPYILTSGDTTQYGYGLAIGEIRGHRAIRHGGGIFGFSTSGTYLPDDDVYVAVFSNTTANEVGPGLVGVRLAAAAVGDPFPIFTEIELPEDVLQRYVGVYQVDSGAQRIVSVEDGALFTSGGGRKTRAYPASDTHFYFPTSNTHFEFEMENGSVIGMLVYPDGAEPPERALRVSDTVPTRTALALDRAVLERYVGVYELQPGFDLTVFLEGDSLMTRATGQSSFRIHASSQTEFYVEEFEARLSFVVGPDGKATEVVLHQGGRDMTAKRKE